MFLHYGVVHLALNMWALWVLGRQLEADARAAAVRRCSTCWPGSAATWRSTCSAPDRPDGRRVDAIFGLFAALFVILRRLGRDTSAILPILVINLIFTFTVPGISIAGHLGGLVVGAVVAAILAYAPRKHRTLVQAVGLRRGRSLVLVAADARPDGRR